MHRQWIWDMFTLTQQSAIPENDPMALPHIIEDLVEKALKPYRNKVVIASKFGVHHNTEGMLVMDSAPSSIRKSIEGSLKRLQTDHIDLYYQHRIDPKVPAEEVALSKQNGYSVLIVKIKL